MYDSQFRIQRPNKHFYSTTNKKVLIIQDPHPQFSQLIHLRGIIFFGIVLIIAVFYFL